MNQPVIHEFAGRDELAKNLANRIVSNLAAGIEDRGRSTLVVSGGRTPERLFEVLAEVRLDWQNVEILLADERWVPDTDERSNARFLREKLLVCEAATANFSALWSDEQSVEDAALALAKRVSNLPAPLDAVILGMGEDGHTASLFPDAAELSEAFVPDAPAALAVSPLSQPEQRITLTPAALTNCRFLAVHIEGDRKWNVLQIAQGSGPEHELPVRSILRTDKVTPEVYWCP